MVKRDEVRDCKTCGHLIARVSIHNWTITTTDGTSGGGQSRNPWWHLTAGEANCHLEAAPEEESDEV